MKYPMIAVDNGRYCVYFVSGTRRFRGRLLKPISDEIADR